MVTDRKMDKGQRAKEEIIDKIITATKAEIYNNRKTSKKHVINDIKRILFHQLRLEEYEASLIQKERSDCIYSKSMMIVMNIMNKLEKIQNSSV